MFGCLYGVYCAWRCGCACGVVVPVRRERVAREPLVAAPDVSQVRSSPPRLPVGVVCCMGLVVHVVWVLALRRQPAFGLLGRVGHALRLTCVCHLLWIFLCCFHVLFRAVALRWTQYWFVVGLGSPSWCLQPSVTMKRQRDELTAPEHQPVTKRTTYRAVAVSGADQQPYRQLKVEDALAYLDKVRSGPRWGCACACAHCHRIITTGQAPIRRAAVHLQSVLGHHEELQGPDVSASLLLPSMRGRGADV